MTTRHPPGFWNRLLGRSDIILGDSVYMRRWRFLNTPWFGIRLHHIIRSDYDRELHDHPFTFLSIILRGGYTEFRPTHDMKDVVVGGFLLGRSTLPETTERWHGPLSFIFRRAEDLHRLELKKVKDVVGVTTFDHATSRPILGPPYEQPAWTLVFRGPVRRKWGFMTEVGWIDAKTFMANDSIPHNVTHLDDRRKA